MNLYFPNLPLNRVRSKSFPNATMHFSCTQQSNNNYITEEKYQVSHNMFLQRRRWICRYKICITKYFGVVHFNVTETPFLPFFFFLNEKLLHRFVLFRCKYTCECKRTLVIIDTTVRWCYAHVIWYMILYEGMIH